MGNAATRSLERVAAAMGELGAAPIEFQAGCDVAQGGVLLALPALMATGLLRYTPEMYQLPNGFYGIDSIFLLLALMALARIRSLEQHDAIIAQRIEKVKLADFTLVGCHRPLRSWSVARSLHFDNAPPGRRCRPALNWS